MLTIIFFIIFFYMLQGPTVNEPGDLAVFFVLLIFSNSWFLFHPTLDSRIEDVLQSRNSLYYSTIENFLRHEAANVALSRSNPNSNVASSTAINELLILLALKRDRNTKIILCPQHLPKFHPKFDQVIRNILREVTNSVLVMLHSDDKKAAW